MNTVMHSNRGITISLCAEEFEYLVNTLKDCASGDSSFPSDYAEVLLQAIYKPTAVVFGNRYWKLSHDIELVRLLERDLTPAQASREYVKLHPERTEKAVRLRVDKLLGRR